MKKNAKFIILFFLFISVLSCSSVQRKPAYNFKKEAVKFLIKSDANLNPYEGIPHTLALCVYQLNDPNKFNQMIKSENDFAKLKRCKPFDESVTSCKRLIIRPASETTEVLDRDKGAAYIGIVAGYYGNPKIEDVTYLYKIPEAWLIKRLKKVNVKLFLGSQQIQDFRGNDEHTKTCFLAPGTFFTATTFSIVRIVV